MIYNEFILFVSVSSGILIVLLCKILSELEQEHKKLLEDYDTYSLFIRFLQWGTTSLVLTAIIILFSSIGAV